MVIKTHRDLAEHIAGRRILLLNSYGKDSVLCLEWLHNYARPSHIVSINFRFMAPHPLDDAYALYLKKRYPRVTWEQYPDLLEVTRCMQGVYQCPLDQLELQEMEYDTFDNGKRNEELRVAYKCDYICLGLSRHESFHRATFFHKNGILNERDHKIYPIGMMSKEQVYSLIGTTGVKVHPLYKISKSTLDQPSYYKMRAAFIANPDYYSAMLRVFPMLALDKYRWEILLKEGNNG